VSAERVRSRSAQALWHAEEFGAAVAFLASAARVLYDRARFFVWTAAAVVAL